MRANCLDDRVGLGIVKERCLAVRPEDDEPRQLRVHPSRDIAGKTRMIDVTAIEWSGNGGKDTFEIHGKTLARRGYHDAPIATVPPMRMCSPAFENSNSGRRKITVPASIRTPPNVVSVPALASL